MPAQGSVPLARKTATKMKRRDAETQRAEAFGHQEMEKPFHRLGERLLNGGGFFSLRPLRLCASAFGSWQRFQGNRIETGIILRTRTSVA